jgi:hypothetical protein
LVSNSNFKKILLEVVAIGRKNAGKDPDNLALPIQKAN